jgi:tetratricopeptide (TPR) repeat protein
MTTKICNYIIEVGIILLIVLTPIYYGSVDLEAITLIELTILFMLFVWGIGMLAQGNIVFRKTPLDIVILLFCAYCVISTLFFSKYLYASYMGLSLVLCISALYFIIVNNIRTKNQLIRLLVVIFIIGFAHAFSHLIQNATGLLRASTGTMLNVGNHFAGYIVIIIPLAVAISFVVEDIGKRILLIFASVIMSSAMAFSLIAGAMLAFILSLVLVAVLFASSENTRKKSSILGGVVICLIVIIFWFGYKPVFQELLTITNLEAGSPAGRLSLWKSTLAMFADNPITGTGLNTFDFIYPQYRLPDLYRQAVYAHSDWLQLLAELGIIGFLIILSGLVIFFITARRGLALVKFEQNWIKGLIVGGLSSVIVSSFHALVEFNIHIPAIAVLFVIIIAITVIVFLGYIKFRQIEEEVTESLQWKRQMPIYLRVIGGVFLFLLVGASGLLILRSGFADSYYRNGIQLESKLFWDEAAGKYKSAFDFSDGNSDYPYALGNIYAKRARLTKNKEMQGKWGRLAIEAYDQAIKICPTNGDYYLAIGNLSEVTGNSEYAELSYTKAISLDLNNAFYHKIYGNFCLKHGNTQKAIGEFRRSLEVYPNDLRKILNECYAISPDRQSFLSIARESCPQNVQSYVALARFCEDRGWYEDALSEYRRMIDMVPEKIEYRIQLSRLLIQLEKFDEAISFWKEFIKSYPQNTQAHAQLASIYVIQNRLNEAIQQYIISYNIEPDNPRYLISVSDLYMKQGNSAKALEIWQTMIKQKPYSSSEAYYRLGIYYESHADWVLALKHFQKAIAGDPRNIGYCLHLAQSYYSKDLYYEAIREWERVLKFYPENDSAHLQLARIYQQLNNQEKSIEHYRQVLKAKPNNIEARMAITHAKM